MIKATQYFIFEANNTMPKAIYVHQYDPVGLLVVSPAHMVFVDLQEKVVFNESDAKKMIRPYSLDKVFYRVNNGNDQEEIYLGVAKGSTEEYMKSVLPPGNTYLFEEIDNPL